MISVSIVSHDQKDLVIDLFKDFERLRPPLVTQIILTHNLTDDRVWFPDHIGHIVVSQIYRGTQLGFGANHNRAFEHSRQVLFTVVNPDIRLPTDPFPALVAAFESPHCAVIGPEVRNTAGAVADSARMSYTLVDSLKSLTQQPKLCTHQPAWVAGMFMLFRADCFERANGFDEHYFMYVEDVDLCARLALSGLSIGYQPSTYVIHIGQFANRKSLKHGMWHLKSAIRWWTSKTFWKHYWLHKLLSKK